MEKTRLYKVKNKQRNITNLYVTVGGTFSLGFQHLQLLLHSTDFRSLK